MTPSEEPTRVGLCATCRLARRTVSDRGEVFYLCTRSFTDPQFPKYPRLPVIECRGYEADSRSDRDGS